MTRAPKTTLPLLSLAIALLASGCPEPVEEPTTLELELVGEIVDGPPRGIAAGADRIWIAQGRALAALDPETGERLADHPASPFESPLVAVEEEGGSLYVASESRLRIFGADGAERSWQESRMGRIRDLAIGPGAAQALVITRNRLVHLELGGGEIRELASLLAPSELASFTRVSYVELGGAPYALILGELNRYPGADVLGLAVVSLAGAEPTAVAVWDAAAELALAGASVEGLALRVEDVEGAPRPVAYLAAGLGQLLRLDLGDPSAPALLEAITIHEGAPLFGLAATEAGSLYLASEGRLTPFDPATGAAGAPLEVALREGALWADLRASAGAEQLWLATSAEVPHPVLGLALEPGALSIRHRVGWLVRSEGGAVAPEWARVYLPTSAGIASYDIGDPSAPRPSLTGYRAGSLGSVNHLLLVHPDPASPGEALLVSSMREGGVSLWPVSAAAPDPGAPTEIPHLPAGWEGAEVFQSDVAVYRDGAELYLLASLSNRATGENALMAYDMLRERWVEAREGSEALVADSGAIGLGGRHAFVACEGGFFAVDLSALPESLRVTDEVRTDPTDTGARTHVRGVAVCEEGLVYVGLDQPGGVLAYRYDEAGIVDDADGPIDARTSATIPGNTAHLDFDPSGSRLLIPARSGNLWAIDLQQPEELRLLTRWAHPFYLGDISDARAFAIGGEPMVLAVKEEEGFSLLRFVTAPAE